MDNLLFGLGVAGIGLVVVFVGLVILIGLIKVLSLAVSRGTKKDQKPAPAVVPAAPIPAAAPVAAEGISSDVIAVITAAVAAVWQENTGFAVRHVRRISNAPAWNRAGREEQTYSRF